MWCLKSRRIANFLLNERVAKSDASDAHDYDDDKTQLTIDKSTYRELIHLCL